MLHHNVVHKHLDQYDIVILIIIIEIIVQYCTMLHIFYMNFQYCTISIFSVVQYCFNIPLVFML
jgi:hypothetical protein